VTITASLQDRAHLAAPAGLGEPAASFTAGAHVLRVWGAAPNQVAELDGRVVVFEGALHDTTALARAAHMAEAACRARPAAAILGAVAANGPAALDDLVGSFWVAVADVSAGRVVVRPDRWAFRGVRYTAVEGGWAWSASIVPLIAWGGPRSIERAVLPDALAYRLVLGNRTIVAGVMNVTPLCEVTLASGAVPRRWDDMPFAPEPADEPRAVWAARLDQALDTAMANVRARHDSVGVLLSGGVDSALLAAKAQRAGFSRVIAWSADIEGDTGEELRRAREIARHLGIEHRVIRVSDAAIAAGADDVLRAVEMLPRNHSDFVLAALLEAAAGEGGAVLYGEAADTLLGPSDGIAIASIERRRRLLTWLPRAVQRGLAGALALWPSSLAQRMALLMRYTAAERIVRSLRLESAALPWTLLRGMPPDQPLVLDFLPEFDPSVEGLLEWEQRRTLAGDCRIHWQAATRLAATLGIGVELPFMDDAVVALARRLPTTYKRDGDWTKPLLRDVARPLVPERYEVLPKLGFPVPMRRWLEGPLKPWLDAALAPGSHVSALLDMAAVRALRWPDDLELLLTVGSLERYIEVFLARPAAGAAA